MRQYADAAALAAYPGGDTVPAGEADAHLRTASRIVTLLLQTRAYQVDDDGLPTDADDITAMSDATCAIVVEAYATGRAKVGGTKQHQSASIGSVSLSNPTSAPGTVHVLGWPIPAAAFAAIAEVGTRGVMVE